ncbi:hypothetical protein [Exiguobacterium sp. s193]|uniref:hypothetical protein n=1 Tax=Exiguobacterium sp. s193 TaxID=2751207 RepID=UPI001BE710F1|nr:hypothetical protein [Exiguobacterium sp. s193]
MSNRSSLVSLTTILTIILLSLFLLDAIPEVMFLVFFIPLALCMLILGISELRHVLREK